MKPIDQLREAQEELAILYRRVGILKDPDAVHIALLRGDIVKPTLDQIIHVYQAEFSARADAVEKAERMKTLKECADIAKERFKGPNWNGDMRHGALSLAAYIETIIRREGGAP